MSSSDIAMSVRGLAKSYTIVHGQQRRPTFRDLLMDRLRNPFKRSTKETFWALKDVSFDVKKGEVVGIIGRNGAGKSTLLKILSRITEPTAGEIDLYGRVGSLLEVGTGFHPELTGRENIFLNGAILGMRKSEIRKQFDAIVDFAEVEKFLDTPVKRYSSGMYVRLAFAVAAHLDPEILIVDEVLAVGDARFQAKCLGRMGEVSRSGRTILFVSHSMQAVNALCTRVALMSNGMCAFLGSTTEGISRYLACLSREGEGNDEPRRRAGSGEYRFESVAAVGSEFKPASEKVIRFRVKRYSRAPRRAYLSALLVNSVGTVVSQFDSRLKGNWLPSSDHCEGELVFEAPWPKPGDYHLDMYICAESVGIVDQFDMACRFTINDLLPYPDVAPTDSYQFGMVLSDFSWRLRSSERAGACNDGVPTGAQ